MLVQARTKVDLWQYATSGFTAWALTNCVTTQSLYDYTPASDADYTSASDTVYASARADAKGIAHIPI